MPRYTEEFKAKAVERCANGERALVVARDIGASHSAVVGWCRKNGVKLQRGQYKAKGYPHPWVVFPMYLGENSIRTIAKELNCSRGRVRAMLKRGGFDTSKRTPVRDAVRDEAIVSAFRSGYYTIEEAGELHGVSETTARVALKHAGLGDYGSWSASRIAPVTRRNKPQICWKKPEYRPKRLYSPCPDGLRLRYDGGLTIEDIARQDGVSYCTVRARLLEYGIDRRGHGRQPDGNGDLRQYLRSHSKYRSWRGRVLRHDGKKCRWCGSTRRLHVDHITPFAELVERATSGVADDWFTRRDACLEYAPLWRRNNGRVLCELCHRKTATYGTGSTDGAQCSLF